MGLSFYMLRLKIQGIKNIENPIEFNFYKKTINNDFNPEKYRIKAIYGENGSGKTAIITSVEMLQNLILNKNYLADNDTQRKLVEMINRKTKKGFIETEFHMNVESVKIIFRYYVSFAVGEDGRVYITEESLEQKNGNYSKNKFEPTFHTKDGELVAFADPDVYALAKEKTQNLLDKQTFAVCLFTIKDKDISEKCRTKNSYWRTMIVVLFAASLQVSIDAEDSHTGYIVGERLSKINETNLATDGMEFINRLKMSKFGTGENNVLVPKKFFSSYEEKIKRMCEFIKIFKPELQDIEIEKKDYDQSYKCNLKMIYEQYSLDREFESRGIKKLMNLFGFLDAASREGMIVFIDELDSNINDVYLDKIIEYFVYYGKGQLCFTSHNLSPMSVLKGNKSAISFISSINTVHTWTNSGNLTPENAYKKGFIEDSPFNVDSSDFLGILGGDDEQTDIIVRRDE